MTPPIIIILLIQIPPFEAPQTLQQEEDKEEGGFLNSWLRTFRGTIVPMTQASVIIPLMITLPIRIVHHRVRWQIRLTQTSPQTHLPMRLLILLLPIKQLATIPRARMRHSLLMEMTRQMPAIIPRVKMKHNLIMEIIHQIPLLKEIKTALTTGTRPRPT
jgi:hypothetical protein